MKADQNKEISYIAYNHANMPTTVRIGPGQIKFIYDPLGNKWYKRVGDFQRSELHYNANLEGLFNITVKD